MAASGEEVEAFIEKVDDVARLISGLAAGTLPAEYVDRRIEAAAAAAAAAATQPQQGRGAKAGARTAPGSDAGGARDAGAGGGDAEPEADAARQAELMRKVRRGRRGGWEPAHPACARMRPHAPACSRAVLT
jgi:hypothetical protein